MALFFVPGPVRKLGAASRTKLLGLVLLAIVAAFVALMIAFYEKTFTSAVPVTVQAQSAGNELVLPADVRERGVLVGRATDVSSNGKLASIQLKLKPSAAKKIPANAKARILPKTLFGDKYVALVPPTHPSSKHLVAGAVIGQDRSKTAVELQQVFRRLVPLLKTLKPVQLNFTLSAVADALRGKGKELGDNLALVNDYFGRLNPHLSTIVHDIGQLATFSEQTNRTAPALLSFLRNTSFTSNTLVDKQSALASFLSGTQGLATTATDFFQRNGQRLIMLPKAALPTLSVLSYYSDEFPCFAGGLARLEPLANQAFDQKVPGSKDTYIHALHINAVPVQSQGAYTYPRDKASYYQNSGPPASLYNRLKGGPDPSHPKGPPPRGRHGYPPPFCYGLSSAAYVPGQDGSPLPHPAKPLPFKQDGSGSAGSTGSGGGSGLLGGLLGGGGSGSGLLGGLLGGSGSGSGLGGLLGGLTSQPESIGATGSPAEQSVISRIVAPILGVPASKVPAPGLADTLVGPLVRGMAVSGS
jgi:virulence factor Mce-like protein